LRCLTKQPDERPGSARELRELLAQISFAEPWSRERAASWWQEHAGGSGIGGEASEGRSTVSAR
jgi:hypothetical protein